MAKAAKRLESVDVALARQTYLDAWTAAMFAGQFTSGVDLREVSRAARAAPPPAGVPRPSDLLLDGLAVLVTEGRSRAEPLLKEGARVFAEDEIALEEGLRWGWLTMSAAAMLWQEDCWHAIMARQLQSVREAGLLIHLLVWCNRPPSKRPGAAISRRLLP